MFQILFKYGTHLIILIFIYQHILVQTFLEVGL